MALVAASAAHAGLFDDEEARKAIVDLRNRIAAVDEQGKARAAESATLNAQLSEQLAATRRSLLDLNNQLEALRAELAKLRGSDEQLSRDWPKCSAARRTWARRWTNACARWSPKS
jgi:chromosome segregation ATPase